MSIADYSLNPSDNTNLGGTNIAEFCPPGNLNDGLRRLMSDIRAALPDTALDLLDEPSYAAMLAKLGAPASTDALTSIAPLVPAVDRLPYFNNTGPAAGALTPFTAFARALVGSGDAAAARGVLGAIGLEAVSMSNPGFVRFSLGGGQPSFQVAWGTFTATANNATAVNYLAAFANQSFPIVSGTGEPSGAAQDNNPSVYSATNTGFQIWNANNACTAFYVAVGF